MLAWCVIRFSVSYYRNSFSTNHSTGDVKFSKKKSSRLFEPVTSVDSSVVHWVRSVRSSSWMVRGDFCCSVSGLAQCSHSLETPNTLESVVVCTCEQTSVFVTLQWAIRIWKQTLRNRFDNSWLTNRVRITLLALDLQCVVYIWSVA